MVAHKITDWGRALRGGKNRAMIPDRVRGQVLELETHKAARVQNERGEGVVPDIPRGGGGMGQPLSLLKTWHRAPEIFFEDRGFQKCSAGVQLSLLEAILAELFCYKNSKFFQASRISGVGRPRGNCQAHKNGPGSTAQWGILQVGRAV